MTFTNEKLLRDAIARIGEAKIKVNQTLVAHDFARTDLERAISEARELVSKLGIEGAKP